MVLGADWLRTYGPVTFDFEELKISFKKAGKQFELQGIQHKESEEKGRKSNDTSSVSTAMLCQLYHMDVEGPARGEQTSNGLP